MKPLKVKPIFNKKNKQVNFSLPKRKLSKEFRDDIPKMKSIKIRIVDWEKSKKTSPRHKELR